MNSRTNRMLSTAQSRLVVRHIVKPWKASKVYQIKWLTTPLWNVRDSSTLGKALHGYVLEDDEIRTPQTYAEHASGKLTFLGSRHASKLFCKDAWTKVNECSNCRLYASRHTRPNDDSGMAINLHKNPIQGSSVIIINGFISAGEVQPPELEKWSSSTTVAYSTPRSTVQCWASQFLHARFVEQRQSTVKRRASQTSPHEMRWAAIIRCKALSNTLLWKVE